MLAKAEYVTRPEDINLGPIWNSMRARQRERDWPHYVMNCQMAQSQGNHIGGFGIGFGSWAALFGDTGNIPAPYDPTAP